MVEQEEEDAEEEEEEGIEDSSAEEEVHEVVDEEGGKAKGKRKRAAAAGGAAKKRGKKEAAAAAGVGDGGVKLAAEYLKDDPPARVNWKEGQQVRGRPAQCGVSAACPKAHVHTLVPATSPCPALPCLSSALPCPALPVLCLSPCPLAALPCPVSQVPYLFLAECFEAIGGESRRLAITQHLTQCFRSILAASPMDLLPTVYLCTNRVAPAHEGLELGIGDSTLIKALAEATGEEGLLGTRCGDGPPPSLRCWPACPAGSRPRSQPLTMPGRKESMIKQDYDKTGDLGLVAAQARNAQRTMFKPQPLTVRSRPLLRPLQCGAGPALPSPHIRAKSGC